MVSDGGDALGRVTLTDQAGTVTAEVTGVYLRRVQRRTVPLPLSQKVFDTVMGRSRRRRTGQRTDGKLVGAGRRRGGTESTAQDFTARFGSPTRRVITADLNDESAVLEAFANTAADPDLPPAGVIVFVGHHPSSGDATPTWRTGACARRDLGGLGDRACDRRRLARQAATAVAGEPRRARGRTAPDDAESGNPGIGSLKGLVRVLAYEHPDLRTTLLDLDADGDAVAALTAEAGVAGRR